MNTLHDLVHLTIPWWNLVLRAALVYFAVLLLLRLGGKRQIAQMGMTEFVALLLISNAVQNAMNGGDNSLLGGLLLAAVLIMLAWGFAYVTYRYPRVERIVQGRPTLLIHHGKLLRRHLARELLTPRELRQFLRKQGIHDLCDVAEAVLASDGFISVVKKNEVHEEEAHPRDDLQDDLQCEDPAPTSI
jgi:uncharacterized membrane protein YcaP (DUF421 family)